MNNIKAIFFDIDGTLVSFETHRIPPSTREAIDILRKQGTKLIIATGRPLSDINNLDDLVFDGYITLNGAYCITNNEEVIHRHSISKEALKNLSVYMSEKKFPCIFMTEKGKFANYIDDSIKTINNLVNLPLPAIKPIEEIIEYDVFQIDTFVTEEEEKNLLENVLTGCDGSRWHPLFVDINPKNNNKATGIKAFLNHYGIRPENTMAFGDGGNDISMLQYAGIGVAMGNASVTVKTAADYITSAVDSDGILNALNHFKILAP